jgi:hypothetical protein
VGAASLTDGWQAAAKKDAPIKNDNFDMYKDSSNIRLKQLGTDRWICKRLAYKRVPRYTAVILTL